MSGRSPRQRDRGDRTNYKRKFRKVVWGASAWADVIEPGAVATGRVRSRPDCLASARRKHKQSGRLRTQACRRLQENTFTCSGFDVILTLIPNPAWPSRIHSTSSRRLIALKL